MLSKPNTATSPGTRRPERSDAEMTPWAIMSLEVMITRALGRSDTVLIHWWK